jgi:hypothetical protein
MQNENSRAEICQRPKVLHEGPRLTGGLFIAIMEVDQGIPDQERAVLLHVVSNDGAIWTRRGIANPSAPDRVRRGKAQFFGWHESSRANLSVWRPGAPRILRRLKRSNFAIPGFSGGGIGAWPKPKDGLAQKSTKATHFGGSEVAPCDTLTRTREPKWKSRMKCSAPATSTAGRL